MPSFPPRVPSSPPDVVSLPLQLSPARGSLKRDLLCFGRTLFVGFWANLLDFGLLAACVRWLHIEAMPSRFIALTISGVLTFIGSRRFVFRAQPGSVPKQATRFVMAELAALPLNLLSFRMCASCAPLVAPELVSFVANALVFVAFSYPVRRLLVFGAARP
jgi:putative flippase GtrA